MATYKSKYYDPAKAHDYYMKHRKLKGRAKKASIADLSDEGKIAAKEVKARIQEELKAALKKVKRGDTATRAKIREQYHEKYLKELESIRQDSKMVKPPKVKKTRLKGAKSGGKKSSGRKSAKAPKEPKEPKAKEKTAKNPKQTMPTLEEIEQAIAEKVEEKIAEIYTKIADMTEEEKATLKDKIKQILEIMEKVKSDGTT